jgi:peptidyl-prolyl cis-trans isomerase SurA
MRILLDIKVAFMLRRFLNVIMLLLCSHVVLAKTIDKVVAVVNDKIITDNDLKVRVNLIYKQLTANNAEAPSMEVLRKQALQRLIDENIQIQLAESNAVAVSEKELDDIIAKIATDNKLSLDGLKVAIERDGIDFKTYRDNMRRDIILSRIQQKAVSSEVSVSAEQVDAYLKTFKHNEKNNYIFTVENIVVPVNVDNSLELERAYKKAAVIADKFHKGEKFTTLMVSEASSEFPIEGGPLGERHLAELPEIFAKEVLKLNKGEISKPFKAPNGVQILHVVDINQSPVQHKIVKSHVRHILLKPGLGMTDTQTISQIKNLYQQLKAGSDFARTAKQYSQDSASAVSGGDLGFVNPEELVPEFAKAMEDLPLRTVSSPVKTSFGWHIIEVLERKTMDDSESFVRQEIRSMLQKRKFSEAVQSWQQKMRSESYIKIVDKSLV